jgi:hypothetical protein
MLYIYRDIFKYRYSHSIPMIFPWSFFRTTRFGRHWGAFPSEPTEPSGFRRAQSTGGDRAGLRRGLVVAGSVDIQWYTSYSYLDLQTFILFQLISCHMHSCTHTHMCVCSFLCYMLTMIHLHIIIVYVCMYILFIYCWTKTDKVVLNQEEWEV